MPKFRPAVRTCLSLLLISITISSPLVAPLGRAHAQEKNLSSDNAPWIAVTGWSSPLILIHPDGSGLIQITPPDAEKKFRFSNLNWSPDGQSLAYAEIERETGRASIWIYRVGSEHPQKLIDNSHGGFAWYPDGTAILYDRYAERVQRETALATCPGDYLAQGPTRFDGLYRYDLATGKEQLLVPAPSKYPLYNPQISPDGTRIIFQQHEWDSQQAYYNELPQYVTSLSSSGQIRPLSGTLGDCRWSADSQKIACGQWDETCAEAKSCPILLFNAQGEEIGTVPPTGQRFNLAPLWSPVNDELAFASTEYRGYADGPCGGGSQPDDTLSATAIEDYTFSDNQRRTLATGEVLDWSPDGSQLLILQGDSFIDNSEIYIYDLKSGQSTFLIKGYRAAWQPSEGNQALLNEALTAKKKLITQLTETSFKSFYGLETVKLNGFDEDSAKELITQYESLQSISDEQLAAFQRLLLQEEALASNLEDATQLAADMGETTADIFEIVWGLGELAVRAPKPLRSVLLNTAVHTSVAFLSQIEDPQMRQAAQDSFDLMTAHMGDNPNADIAQLLSQYFLSNEFAKFSTQNYLQRYLDSVQPEIENGVRSAALKEGAPWTVNDTQAAAKLEAQRAISVSHIAHDTAHEIYADVQDRSKISDFLTDISDLLVTASGGTITWLDVSAVLTRLPSFAIEAYQNAVLSNALTCVTYMSSGAGELIFQPTGEFAECPQLANLAQLPSWFDRVSWGRAQQSWTSQASGMRSSIEAIQSAVNSGEVARLDNLASDFETRRSVIQTTNHLAQTLLIPVGGYEFSQVTGRAAFELFSLDVELSAYQVALNALQEDPNDLQARKALQSSTAALLTRLDSIPGKFAELASLPGGGQAAVPVILEAPTTLQVGEKTPATINLKVANAGSVDLQSAHLNASLAGSELQAVDLPMVPAGSVISQQITFTPQQTGQQILTLKLADARRTDTIQIPLTVVGEVEWAQLQRTSTIKRILQHWPWLALFVLGLALAIISALSLLRRRSV